MKQLLYPIGLQSFTKLREDGFVYVDKTEFIHKLISECQYVFLSRPRRFGKSLLISTIEEFFKGRRDLFEGLAITHYDHDWAEHAVLHVDLSGCDGDSDDNVEAYLDNFLTGWERKYGLPTDRSVKSGLRFKEVIMRAYEQTGKRVVILVDEYDKPLLETVGKPEIQELFRNQLRSFYSNLKSCDSYIRFAMLTGVTKFGHLSIFSDLNNLRDISLSESYSGICGITKEELYEYFHSGVHDFAKYKGISDDEIYRQLKENYDGYHFSPERSPDMFNPFSLLNCLADKNFGDYWFRTGTPIFLIRMIQNHRISIRSLTSYKTPVATLTDVSFDLGNPIPVLYQSGYLSIKGYDSRTGRVTLGFPNGEVERGFLSMLFPLYAYGGSQRTEFDIFNFLDDVESGDVDGFMNRLQSLFSDFQYDGFDSGHLEQHYQDVLFILCKLLGFYTRIEYKTSAGRIDMVIKTPEYIYVFEFKVDKPAEVALRQIDEKDYLLPFKADGRKLIKVGVSFTSAKRGIAGWEKHL